jgi:hypothetical protein
LFNFAAKLIKKDSIKGLTAKKRLPLHNKKVVDKDYRQRLNTIYYEERKDNGTWYVHAYTR